MPNGPVRDRTLYGLGAGVWTRDMNAAYRIGRAIAKRFDERGEPYFLREVYDAFYPGYGASWPLFQGSIATTYEQASTRGLSSSPTRSEESRLISSPSSRGGPRASPDRWGPRSCRRHRLRVSR